MLYLEGKAASPFINIIDSHELLRWTLETVEKKHKKQEDSALMTDNPRDKESADTESLGERARLVARIILC